MESANFQFDLDPLPTPSDTLFLEDSKWWHNACLDMVGKGWESYANGYKKAADMLAIKFMENYQGLDSLIFPIIFLYRHYVELRLKQIILLYEPDRKKEGHDLIKLWEVCHEIFVSNWPEEPKTEWDNIERLVLEFSKMDSNNINFRYPETRQNNKNPQNSNQPTLPSLSKVSIRNLHEVMQRLAIFFENHVDAANP
jgi:hypothetical protein